MSKRYLTQQLAKEDVKRFRNGKISISKEISTDDSFRNIYEVLTKKSKANEIDNYIKGADTWLRRIGTITVAQIQHLVDSKINEEENIEQIQKYNNITHDDTKSNISTKSDLKIVVDTKIDNVSDETKSDISKTSSIKSEAKSYVSKAKSNVSKAESNISKAKTSISTINNKNDYFDKMSESDSFEIESADTNSVVSHASSYVSQTKSDTSQANSDISKQSIISKNSDTKSVVSDTKSSTSKVSTKIKTRDTILSTIEENTIDLKNAAGFMNEESEDDINIWYQNKLAELNTKSLRDEQYRRKKAMLRVEYWTKMDKLKNNATPTVINQ